MKANDQIKPTLFVSSNTQHFGCLRPFTLNDRQLKMRELILKPRLHGFSRTIEDLIRGSTFTIVQ